MRYISLLLVFVLCCGCTLFNGNPPKRLKNNVDNALEDFTKPSRGYLIVAALIEMNSNFSSLLYDKTKASFENYVYADYGNKIPKRKFKYYVQPERVTRPGEVTYNDVIKTIIERVIILNKLGDVVSTPEDANFIVITYLNESFERRYGENSSNIEISILDIDNRPVMYTKVTSMSKSDENFFYFPTKTAKSVKYLTVKGLGYLLDKSFSKLFQEG